VLFNESQSRIVVSVLPAHAEEAMRLAAEEGTPVQRLGEAGGDALSIAVNGRQYRWTVEGIFDSWYFSIERLMSSGLSG
jgi:phosphoribosylformylglycinamidine (FGAM) synthase-like enzyme